MAKSSTLRNSSVHQPQQGSTCANCSAKLYGLWCSKCGQKWAPIDPTWHDVLHEAMHEFLHLDGKIFLTIRKLFLRPGELTAEFLQGRRATYIAPLRLYLTFSLIYFLLSAIVPNPDPVRPPNLAQQSISNTSEAQGIMAHTLTKAFPKVAFAMVPVFAWLLMLSYWNRRCHYPQYMYFSLHLHAALFGFLTLTVPLQLLTSERWLKVAELIAIAGTFVYLVLALKRVFGGRTYGVILRACGLMLAHAAMFLAAVVAVVQLVLSGWLGNH